MSESREQLTQKDIQGPEKESAEPGIEVARTPELERAVDAADNLANKIKGDKNVTEGDVAELEETLGKLKYNIAGEEMTIEELKAADIEKIKRNLPFLEMAVDPESNETDLFLSVPEISWMTPNLYRRIVENLEKRNDCVDMLSNFKRRFQKMKK